MATAESATIRITAIVNFSCLLLSRFTITSARATTGQSQLTGRLSQQAIEGSWENSIYLNQLLTKCHILQTLHLNFQGKPTMFNRKKKCILHDSNKTMNEIVTLGFSHDCSRSLDCSCLACFGQATHQLTAKLSRSKQNEARKEEREVERLARVLFHVLLRRQQGLWLRLLPILQLPLHSEFKNGLILALQRILSEIRPL